MTTAQLDAEDLIRAIGAQLAGVAPGVDFHTIDHAAHTALEAGLGNAEALEIVRQLEHADPEHAALIGEAYEIAKQHPGFFVALYALDHGEAPLPTDHPWAHAIARIFGHSDAPAIRTGALVIQHAPDADRAALEARGWQFASGYYGHGPGSWYSPHHRGYIEPPYYAAWHRQHYGAQGVSPTPHVEYVRGPGYGSHFDSPDDFTQWNTSGVTDDAMTSPVSISGFEVGWGQGPHFDSPDEWQMSMITGAYRPPPPPPGRPAPPMGRPAPPMSRPAPPMARPAPPMARPAPPPPGGGYYHPGYGGRPGYGAHAHQQWQQRQQQRAQWLAQQAAAQAAQQQAYQPPAYQPPDPGAAAPPAYAPPDQGAAPPAPAPAPAPPVVVPPASDGTDTDADDDQEDQDDASDGGGDAPAPTTSGYSAGETFEERRVRHERRRQHLRERITAAIAALQASVLPPNITAAQRQAVISNLFALATSPTKATAQLVYSHLLHGDAGPEAARFAVWVAALFPRTQLVATGYGRGGYPHGYAYAYGREGYDPHAWYRRREEEERLAWQTAGGTDDAMTSPVSITGYYGQHGWGGHYGGGLEQAPYGHEGYDPHAYDPHAWDHHHHHAWGTAGVTDDAMTSPVSITGYGGRFGEHFGAGPHADYERRMYDQHARATASSQWFLDHPGQPQPGPVPPSYYQGGPLPPPQQTHVPAGFHFGHPWSPFPTPLPAQFHDLRHHHHEGYVPPPAAPQYAPAPPAQYAPPPPPQQYAPAPPAQQYAPAPPAQSYAPPAPPQQYGAPPPAPPAPMHPHHHHHHHRPGVHPGAPPPPPPAMHAPAPPPPAAPGAPPPPPTTGARGGGGGFHGGGFGPGGFGQGFGRPFRGPGWYGPGGGPGWWSGAGDYYGPDWIIEQRNDGENAPSPADFDPEGMGN